MVHIQSIAGAKNWAFGVDRWPIKIYPQVPFAILESVLARSWWR